MEEVFVGRQPILDANGDLFAYELLYRNSNNNYFPNIDPEIATIGVIVNTFLSPGFEQIAAKKTFINFSASLLVTDIFDTLAPERIVIEILEDVKITPIILSKLQKLKSAGFQLALDDFILQKQFDKYPALFQMIDYIKVDFVSTTESQRVAIESLKSIYPQIKLLAEKVETVEQFTKAKAIGYELFQGYFFAKPDIVKNTKLPAKTLLYFEVLKLLNYETPNIEEIATLIMQDVSLSYRLLKQLNTYAFKSSKKVISVHQAIVIMGLKDFKKWIQFLVIYQESSKGPDGRSKALINYSLTRANLCELLAAESGKANTDEYYMLGMFSLIDVILEREPSYIFPLLPVTTEIIDTLCGHQTEMTPYLRIVVALEKLDYTEAIQQAELLGISEKELSEISLKVANAS
jgi:EAL and modified HD-GYP domain-containing signal transduction protein